jgi:transposase InsO family protein
MFSQNTLKYLSFQNKEAATVAEAIFNQWICRHGTPVMLLSDQDKEFCNEIMDNLCKLMGIQKSRTTPYHPQCNSQVEVINKHVARYLGDFVSSGTLDWEQHTPFFLTYGLYHRTPYFFINTRL